MQSLLAVCKSPSQITRPQSPRSVMRTKNVKSLNWLGRKDCDGSTIASARSRRRVCDRTRESASDSNACFTDRGACTPASSDQALASRTSLPHALLQHWYWQSDLTSINSTSSGRSGILGASDWRWRVLRSIVSCSDGESWLGSLRRPKRGQAMEMRAFEVQIARSQARRAVCCAYFACCGRRCALLPSVLHTLALLFAGIGCKGFRDTAGRAADFLL